MSSSSSLWQLQMFIPCGRSVCAICDQRVNVDLFPNSLTNLPIASDNACLLKANAGIQHVKPGPKHVPTCQWELDVNLTSNPLLGLSRNRIKEMVKDLRECLKQLEAKTNRYYGIETNLLNQATPPINQPFLIDRAPVV